METQSTGKSLTDLMIEINDHRYLQYQGFKGTNDVPYATTTLCVDPINDTLQILFHDVRQPLVHYVLPVADFKRLCSIPDREQNENKLPEEKAGNQIAPQTRFPARF